MFAICSSKFLEVAITLLVFAKQSLQRQAPIPFDAPVINRTFLIAHNIFVLIIMRSSNKRYFRMSSNRGLLSSNTVHQVSTLDIWRL